MQIDLLSASPYQHHRRVLHHLGWLIALLISLVTPTLVLAQTPSASFAGVYKAWSSTPEGGVIDSTLYLNLDGSALLVDTPLSGATPTTRTGQWAPGGTGVILTLTGSAAGALPQPIVVNLDASAGQPLVTLPGDIALDGRSWRFYAFSYLAENRDALSYNADMAAGAITAGGLAGVYKTIAPNTAGGWSEVTLTLYPDFRAILARNALDGRSPSLTYGAWQDIGGQPLLTFTETDGVAFAAPVELSFVVEKWPSTRSEHRGRRPGRPCGAAVLSGGRAGQRRRRGARWRSGRAGWRETRHTARRRPDSARDSTSVRPRFETAACPAELPADAGVTCGYLTVPENRRRTDSGTVRRFAVTLAANAAPVADPVIVLTEGAGVEMATLIEWFADAPVRAQRSIILLAPRGEGFLRAIVDVPRRCGERRPSHRVAGAGRLLQSTASGGQRSGRLYIGAKRPRRDRPGGDAACNADQPGREWSRRGSGAVGGRPTASVGAQHRVGKLLADRRK
jgi:hypothetical protein